MRICDAVDDDWAADDNTNFGRATIIAARRAARPRRISSDYRAAAESSRAADAELTRWPLLLK